MTYEILKHPLWNYQLCCIFAGFILAIPEDAGHMREVKVIAGRNFRRIYKTLSVQERLLVRGDIAEFKKNPVGAMQSQIDTLRGLQDDDGYIEQIKNSDEL